MVFILFSTERVNSPKAAQFPRPKQHWEVTSPVLQGNPRFYLGSNASDRWGCPEGLPQTHYPAIGRNYPWDELCS